MPADIQRQEQSGPWKVCLEKKLEGERGGRAALLAGTVAGNAELRFRLYGHSRMGNQACINGLPCRGEKGISVNHRNCCCGAIRALLGRCAELWITTRQLAALRHAHHAVVFSITTAARRQVCLAPGSQCKERLDKRQAEKSQQRNGEEFPQRSY